MERPAGWPAHQQLIFYIPSLQLIFHFFVHVSCMSHVGLLQEEGQQDSQLINSVYLDNSSMELYHGRLDKKPNAIALRIRSGCAPGSEAFDCTASCTAPARVTGQQASHLRRMNLQVALQPFLATWGMAWRL